ncbi:MAG: peptidylprolyl isomerase [Flavobacteriales bacterium]
MRLILISVFFISYLNVNSQTQVDFFTNYGDFRIELYDSLVPITSSNFINLVSTEFYDGALFHRVIDNFMIQGGDVNPPPPIIQDEFDSTLSNIQMTISMANSGPNTGTCQFFINLVNNTYLDFDKAPFTSKHPVFGITISGFNIVQDIGNVQTNFNDVPYVDVVMDSVRIVNTQVSVDDRNYVSNRKLVKIIDFLGRDSKIFSKKPLIFIYDNGEVEKKIIQ